MTGEKGRRSPELKTGNSPKNSVFNPEINLLEDLFCNAFIFEY